MPGLQTPAVPQVFCTTNSAARGFPGPLPRWDESRERAHRRTRGSLARPPPGLHGLTGKKTGRETGSSIRVKSPEMPAVKRRADDIHVPSPDVRHRKRTKRRDATPPPEAASRGGGVCGHPAAHPLSLAPRMGLPELFPSTQRLEAISVSSEQCSFIRQLHAAPWLAVRATPDAAGTAWPGSAKHPEACLDTAASLCVARPLPSPQRAD